MRRNSLTLKKSVFIRLCVITFAAVLVFYAIGLSINGIGIQNVRDDMSAALATATDFVGGELAHDFENLRFFMLETLSDKALTRYAISYDILDDYQRLSYIKSLSELEYMIKRFSNLTESVQIMFPRQGRTIITEQDLFTDLNEAAWQALLARSEKGSVTLAEWQGRLWMLLPRYDRAEPLFLIAIEITPDSLLQRLERVAGDQTEGMLLLRQDGSVFAGNDGGMLYLRAEAGERRDRNLLVSEADIPQTGLTLRCYGRINEQLRPFVHYRTALWMLTLVALALLAVYLLYYRINVLRPLNDIFDTMRQAGRDGRYRIQWKTGGDYDDIYAQFNDMVDHIEELAEQVYEARYRAQKAELKQLQMQIDPHFLYNSLYLIYRIAVTDGNKSIAKLSLNLSNYYRYITKMPEQIVLLKDEINHVLNYLEIQEIRFSPRIRIDVQPLPEAIANERIPSLIIQPIVENAFQHGVKDCTEGGVVSMRYEYTPEQFKVVVADNSGKMTDERVAALWRMLESGDDGGASALSNLYRRMQLYQDGGHGLELRCADGGLTVILTFQRGMKPA